LCLLFVLNNQIIFTLIYFIIVFTGPTAFIKGITPKLIVIGPKLVFSFTVAQQLIPLLDNFFVAQGIISKPTQSL
jgi:hypothetical protein